MNYTREQLVRAQQMRDLDRAMTASPFALMLAAALLVYALWGHVNRGVLMAWIFAIVLFQAGRLAQSLYFRRNPPPPEKTDYWLNLYTVMTLLSACLWGVGAVMLYISDSLPHQALLTMVLVGLVSGSVAVNTAHRATHFAFALPVLVPLAIRTALEGDLVHIITAALLLLFLGFLLITGGSVSRRMLESLRMRFENVELIEELKQQKHAAESAQRAAEEANQAKSRFLAAASHDLRQPLHALSLFAGVLEQTVQQSDAKPVLGSLRNSVDALESLFNELLDISKLDAGAITPNVSEFALAPLFARVRNDFEPQAHARGLRLRVRATSLATRGDPILLERIVRNFVSNAIRYTSTGDILLGCRRRGGYVDVQVLDSGIGIPQTERTRIFEEFYQIGNPERDRGKGLGLGLAIVKRLSELLGYSVNIESAVGRGSCFSVRVPRVSAAALPLQTPAAAVTAHNLADYFVVVVDDDADARESLRALLRSWHCRVLAADGPEETERLLLARGERPDVVVCDFRMRSERDGIALIQSLRKIYGETLPAIILSGESRAAQTLTTLRVEWLQKPASPERLRAALFNLLQLDVTKV